MERRKSGTGRTYYIYGTHQFFFLLMTFLIKELSFLKKEVAEAESCFFTIK